MLYQENGEGEQGNPFRTGPTGLAPERPRVSHGGAEATAEPLVSTTLACPRLHTGASGRVRAQVGVCGSVHRQISKPRGSV